MSTVQIYRVLSAWFQFRQLPIIRSVSSAATNSQTRAGSQPTCVGDQVKTRLTLIYPQRRMQLRHGPPADLSRRKLP